MTQYKFRRIGELQTCLALNAKADNETTEKTVAITGVPRGGTSLVAAATNALGVYLGPSNELREFHFEDQTMNSPIPQIQYDYIRKQNAEHAVWGWKDPTGIESACKVLYALRNPHIIIVFRDLLASIQGEMRFDKEYCPDSPRPFSFIAETMQRWWKTNWEFILHTQFPTLLVSYERAMLHPLTFVQELASFLKIELTKEYQDEALSRINQKGGYLIVPVEGFKSE